MKGGRVRRKEEGRKELRLYMTINGLTIWFVIKDRELLVYRILAQELRP